MTQWPRIQLLWSPKSPFVRKVVILAHELAFADQIELVRTVADPFGVPNADILGPNPLGRIPTLLVEGQPAIFESRLICAWLEAAAGRAPANSEHALLRAQREAVADGLLENLVLRRLLFFASPTANAELLVSGAEKIKACLRYFEKAPEGIPTTFDATEISLLCALSHLDFRFPESEWKRGFPGLASWYLEQEGRPSVAANPIVDDQNTSTISTSLFLGKE